MTPTFRLICGDALAELKKMPDNSVHCVVISLDSTWQTRYNAGKEE
jgi:hypothetical protein